MLLNECMGKISLPDFFKYHDPTNTNQLEAIVLLESMMPTSLLQDDSAWVQKYREPLPAPLTPPWPVTKEQLGFIMQCSSETLNDALISDLARCVADCEMDTLELVYFLGQCGHESAGLRYPVEIHDGSNYEGRSDLGNVQPGDGVKFAGTGWLQMTGRFNHQAFSNYLREIGKPDPKVMDIGKTYTSEVYPWMCSGFWWFSNGMVELCKNNPNVDEVGARVNGRYLPNGYEDRRKYTERAFHVLGC